MSDRDGGALLAQYDRYRKPTNGVGNTAAGSWPEDQRGDADETDYRQEPEATPHTSEGPAADGWQPFPLDALPEPARSFTSETARAIGCDVAFITLPLLATLAAAIGNSRRIRLKRTWSEPAVLWLLPIAESGQHKSPAYDAPLRAIRARQDHALAKHREALAGHETAKRQYEADLAEWRKHGRKAGVEAPQEPEEPVCERFWCSDTTVEGLASLLAGAPRGLLLAREELAGWVRSFDCYRGGRGGDTAHWLSMHGARGLLVDRKTGQRVVSVPMAAVSITGTIQPATLARAINREHYEDGLAARLLVAMPPRRRRRWTDLETDPAIEDALAAVIDRLYALDLPIHPVTHVPQPRSLPLSPEGYRAWVAFYNEHGAEQEELTGDLAAAWSKLEGYSARLALVIHLTRWAAGDPTLADSEAVDAESIGAGVTLSRWFGQETRRVYAVLGESEENREQRELVELIRARGGRITVRELMQASRRYRTAGDAEQALAELVKDGKLTCQMVSPARGPSVQTWRLASV
jgi:hypothetical protein